MIEEEADHLAAMIEDLLDASRLQAGGLSQISRIYPSPPLWKDLQSVSVPRLINTP